jgi:putative ABC transport system substrate-binding protein
MRFEHEYVARKLNGEGTEFMPVAEPTKFEFIISLKAAKQIGITLPYELLGRANKVIQ